MNRFWIILRTAILFAALSGLVTAPLAAYANHAHTAAGAMSEMEGDTPCCPDDAHHDCTKCAMAAECMSHCVGLFWKATAYPPLLQTARISAHFLASRFAVGSDPAPPYRPPNA